MVNHSVVCALLATAFHLLIPSEGRKLSDSFAKCEVGDDVCMAHRFTGFMQHSEEHPGVGIPNLSPYVSRHPIRVQSFQLTPALSSSAYWSNITIHGANRTVIQWISGFQPKEPVSDVLIKIFIPHLTVEMNTNARFKFVLLTVKTNGKITMHLENLEIWMNCQAVIVQRDGKDYVNLRDMSVQNRVSHFRGHIKYDNAIQATVYRMVDGMINRSWRVLKPMMDPTINRAIETEVGKDIIASIFKDIAMQDFFNM